METEDAQDELFLNVKKQIAWYFGINLDDELAHKSIVADLNVRVRRTRKNNIELPKLVIEDEEIKQAMDAVKLPDQDSLEMVCEDRNYECLVQGASSSLFRDDCFGKDIHDKKSKLVFNLGWASFDYCIFLLVAQAERDDDLGIRRYPRFVITSEFDELEKLDWKICLPILMGVSTIKINLDVPKRLRKDFFDIHARSFEFKIMYCRDLPIRRMKTVEDLSSQRLGSFHHERFTIDNVPLRKYDEEAITYYRLGLSSSDPYLQFLSYYRVLEYYFPRALKTAVAKELRERIESPDFSFEDDALFRVANSVKKTFGFRRENGSGGEQQDLTCVLEDYVENIEQLRDALESYEENLIKYYAEERVPFTSEDKKEDNTIDWDKEGIWKKIAKRIYSTRNALIHSKDLDNVGRYDHFKNSQDLQKEIPLIKTLAKIVISETGELLV